MRADTSIAILRLENLSAQDEFLIRVKQRNFKIEYSTRAELLVAIWALLVKIRCSPESLTIQIGEDRYQFPNLLMFCFGGRKLTPRQLAEITFSKNNIKPSKK